MRIEVEGLLRRATSWEERLEGPDRETWERARRDGLDVPPQRGLVPLGVDRRSGHWESAHVDTGTIPARDAAGELALDDDSAIVLVLLPGGTFLMGSSEEVDTHVHEVQVPSFFLAKHEVAQAQWIRLTGANPSYFHPGNDHGFPATLLHPVENVSWLDARERLRPLGLDLPSESCWEYAARAGTTTRWWTGDLAESLPGKANVADRSIQRHAANLVCDDWDDGFPIHSAVGAAGSANPLGLHDVIGNVYEWCLDTYREDYRDAPLDGSALVEPGSTSCVARSGAWDGPGLLGRSAHRSAFSPAFRNLDLDVRPARRLAR